MQQEKEQTSFFERVYEVTCTIPYGKVTSFGAIAKVLGSPKSARMVGWALNSVHNRSDVPAHRVLNRKGLLTGKHHFQGTNLMQQLLESEGHQIMDNQLQNFEESLWTPPMAE